MAAAKQAQIIFTYDVVCPYAYMASHLIQGVAKRSRATLHYKPVLLGGLYQLDKAQQGAAGSATDTMPAPKKMYSALDLQRQAARFNVTLKIPDSHPQRSLQVQRLLCTLESEEQQQRLIELSTLLYHSYWVLNEDITDQRVIEKYVQQINLQFQQQRAIDLNVTDSPDAKQLLQDNTQWAFDNGAFGVPMFFVTNSRGERDQFFGGDRLHFVESFCTGQRVDEYRAVKVDKQISSSSSNNKKYHIDFIYDFSSPWTFLAYTQLQRITSLPHVDVKLVPVLLGAVFRAIGTANTPMSVMSDNKRAYSNKDMQDYAAYHNVTLNWPSHFPLRTVQPLRVVCIEPRTAECIFKAGWQDDLNIGDEKVLLEALKSSGFDNAEQLIAESKTDAVKKQLTKNTDYALQNNVFGCPTFLVREQGSDSEPILVFGQDRYGTVLDIVSGWRPPKAQFGVWPVKNLNSHGGSSEKSSSSKL